MGFTVSGPEPMTFAEYEALSQRTMNTAQNYDQQLSNVALGLAGEAGEIADLIKKHLHHGHHLDARKLELELGDLLFYLQWAAGLIGLSLEDVARTNVAKLAARYPDGFSSERSINRETKA